MKTNGNYFISTFLCILLVVSFFSCAYAQEMLPDEKKEHLEKNNDAVERGYVDKKQNHIKKNEPDDFQLMLQKGSVDNALSALEKIAYHDRDWKTYFWLGTAYLVKNRLNEAAQSLDTALTLQGGVADIWIQRAIVEQERNNLTEVVQLLQLAIQIEPKSAKAYLNLAYAYEALKQPKHARAAYGFYLKFADGKSVEDIRLKQKILSNVANKNS